MQQSSTCASNQKFICLVTDEHGEIVAMAHIDEHMKVKFFTEDDSVSDIKAIGDISLEANT